MAASGITFISSLTCIGLSAQLRTELKISDKNDQGSIQFMFQYSETNVIHFFIQFIKN
jgi:hypothetical protein